MVDRNDFKKAFPNHNTALNIFKTNTISAKMSRRKKIQTKRINSFNDSPQNYPQSANPQSISNLIVKLKNEFEAFKSAPKVKKSMETTLKELRKIVSTTNIDILELVLKNSIISILKEQIEYMHDDPAIVYSILWIITNLSIFSTNYESQFSHLLDTIFKIMKVSPLESIWLPILEQCTWAVGNITLDSDQLKNKILNNLEVFQFLVRFLDSKDSNLTMITLWTLCNLTYKNSTSSIYLIENGIMEALQFIFKREQLHEIDEAIWLLANLFETDCLQDEQINPFLMNLINRINPNLPLRTIQGSLRAIGNLFSGTKSAIIENVFFKSNFLQNLESVLRSEERTRKECVWILGCLAASSQHISEFLGQSEELLYLLLGMLNSKEQNELRKEVLITLYNLSQTVPAIISMLLKFNVHLDCLTFLQSNDSLTNYISLSLIDACLSQNKNSIQVLQLHQGREIIEKILSHPHYEVVQLAETIIKKYFDSLEEVEMNFS